MFLSNGCHSSSILEIVDLLQYTKTWVLLLILFIMSLLKSLITLKIDIFLEQVIHIEDAIVIRSRFLFS